MLGALTNKYLRYQNFFLMFIIFIFIFYPCIRVMAEENIVSENTATQIKNENGYHLSNPSLKKGVLLIAARKLQEPVFEKTVILITEYSNDGTTGIVINRRTKIPVAQALPQLTELLPVLEHLYIGGPVMPNAINLLMSSKNELVNAKKIFDDIYLIDTLELFNDVFANHPDTEYIRIYSGYAGWAPGQLESELMRGDWYLWHTSRDMVFNNSPELLWQELIQVVTAKWVMR